MSTTILAIESSCDDTSAAVLRDGVLLSNTIASQKVHERYGGVVPELASRSHQQNIIPVVDDALKQAGVSINDIDAVGFTRGPGLLGSLLVGSSFAKAFALAKNCKLIEVNHLHGHVLANFLVTPETVGKEQAQFPFLCLLVSGGHSQIIVVKSFTDMEIIGTTIDDAAGEAFDKSAKVLGLPYPGGPHIDRHAKLGNPKAFQFSKPQIPDLDYSFSGFKTSLLYFLQKEVKQNPNFIAENIDDICASAQATIIDILMKKLILAAKQTGIRDVVIGGGVAANSGLRDAIVATGEKYHWRTFLPELRYTTDNAAMIGLAAYHKYQAGQFATQDLAPRARYSLQEYFGK